MNVTPPCFPKLHFDKRPVDKYVKEHVFLRTNLSRDVERQLEQARFECKLDFRKEIQAAYDIVDGVRVGVDFIDSPITMDQFQFCEINKLELCNCLTRSSAALELGLNRVLLHFAEDYLQGEHLDENEVTHTLGSYNNDLRQLFMKINNNLRSEMFSAFKLGMFDGLEDGRSMMQIILGKNPSGTCWFPFLLPEDSLFVDQEENNSALRLVPIMVQERTEREDDFRIRLRHATREVAMLEATMQNLLVELVRYELFGKRQEPVSMHKTFERETELTNRLKTIMDLLYDLGNSCGFETGQRTVKNLYFHSHSDEQIYTLLQQDQSKWLLIDTSLSTSCNCGFRCPSCIKNRTNQKLKKQWDCGMKEFACRMRSVSEQIEERNFHARKLFED